MNRRDFFKRGLATGFALQDQSLYCSPSQSKPFSDVVVLIPGFLGSTLQKEGRAIWELSARAFVSGIMSSGRNLSDLTLEGDSEVVDDIGDGVSATALIKDLHMIPGLWKVDGYSEIQHAIITRYNCQIGSNYFDFPYDWRRDIRVSARQLAHKSRQWLYDWRRRSGNAEARLVLIGHSMGGLVARQFLEVHGGWADTRVLITFGTPFGGSLNALDAIANGVSKTWGPLTLFDLSSVVRSFTSVYQALPRFPCYDPGNGELVRVGEVSGIPNVDPVRAGSSLRFIRAMDEAANSNVKVPKYIDSRHHFFPVVGRGNRETLHSAKFLSNNGIQMSTHLPGRESGTLTGDGTVPEIAATPFDPAPFDTYHPMYTSAAHSQIQNTRSTLDHVEGLLFSRAALRSIPPAVAVAVKDIHTSKGRITVRAFPSPMTTKLSDYKLPLRVMVSTFDGKRIKTQDMKNVESYFESDLSSLPKGAYRVTILDSSGSHLGSNTFVVISANR